MHPVLSADFGAPNISKVEFIDHRVPLNVNDLVGKDRTVRPSGANGIARRVWQLLDLASPALEFC